MHRASLPIFLALALAATGLVVAADAPDAVRTAKILASAREVMSQARYCALISVDSAGQPQARTVDPLPGDDSLDV